MIKELLKDVKLETTEDYDITSNFFNTNQKY